MSEVKSLQISFLFSFKKKRKKPTTSFSFLFCQQKARTVLNSDRKHMPQAFKGHLASSCPSEPKVFSGIGNTSVVSTFPRQEGIYFLPCTKRPLKSLLHPFTCAIDRLRSSGSTVWNDTLISNTAESWKGGLTAVGGNHLQSVAVISISSSLLFPISDKYIQFR